MSLSEAVAILCASGVVSAVVAVLVHRCYDRNGR